MRINHNITSLNTHRQLSTNTAETSKNIEKLSSGLRINRAGDDAAGLAISEKMRGQIRGLDQASRNAQDGISLIQTAEGALNETHSILQRMRELATQASNDTNTTADRSEIQKEINQLTSEINRIGNTTEFNTQKLLNGNKNGAASAAVAGDHTITLSAAFAVGDTISIDGVNFTAAAANNSAAGEFIQDSPANQAAGLVAAINANTTLNAKYTATVSGTDVQLVQKAGFESSTAPAVSDSSATVTTGVTPNTAGAAVGDIKQGAATLQIGANGGQQFTVDISDMRSDALKIATDAAATTTVNATSGKQASYTTSLDVTDGTSSAGTFKSLDVSSATKATAAIDVFDDAIKAVSAERSKLGAFQNRLDHTINNLNTSSENLTAAESRVRDVDMAKEMMAQTKNNILSQAAQAMLAQANQQPQGVLQLLRG